MAAPNKTTKSGGASKAASAKPVRQASTTFQKASKTPVKDTAPTSSDIAKRVGGGTDAAQSTQHPAFQQTLSVGSMVVYCLIFMVPVAPFAIYGNVFQDSNGMPALAYIIGMVAMIFTVFSFGVMIKRFPSSGSIYTYTSESMSKFLGFETGWLMLLQYLITPCLMYLMAGQALNQYVPWMPVWGWCLIFMAFVTFVSTRKLSATIMIDRVALVCQLIVIVMFIVFGIMYIVHHPETSSFSATAFIDPEKFSFGAEMSAVSLCVMSFVGFGSVATLTQEAKNMKTGPFHAMLITVLMLGFLFVLMCLVGTWVSPDGELFRTNGNNGFYILAGTVGGEWFGVVCAVTNALALGIFSGLAGQTSVSRILYVMGKSGSMPKWFGKMNKNDVPIRATLFVSALSLVILFPMYFAGVDSMAKVSNFGALSTYFLLNVCVIWLYWIKLKDHTNVVRYLIFPAIGALITGGIFCSLSPLALFIGFIWIVIGVIYYQVETKVFHKQISMG